MEWKQAKWTNFKVSVFKIDFFLSYLTVLLQLHKLYSMKWDGEIILICKYARIWKEFVMACFKILSCHLPQEAEENNKNLSLYIR
jgi:hypothetical protein